MSMDERLAFDERQAKLIAFFFFSWQSRVKAAVAPSSASIKQALRKPLLLVKGLIPGLFDVDARKPGVRVEVD
jgi:hypothetical protein